MNEDIGGGWGVPCDPVPPTEVEIRLATGRRKLKAFVFGVWAVHAATSTNKARLPAPGSWSVSHLPTGTALGIAYDIEFWDAVRIARALEDTGVCQDAKFPDSDDIHLIFSTVAAALHDHYVWPIAQVSP